MTGFKVFQHHIETSTLIALLADALLCFFAAPFVVAALWEGSLHSVLFGGDAAHTIMAAGSYALIMPLLCSAVGLYRNSSTDVSTAAIATRVGLGLTIGAVITYVIFQSGGAKVSSALLVATVLGYVVVVLLLVRVVLFGLQRALGRARVLIVGNGEDAHSVAGDLSALRRTVVGFYATTLEEESGGLPGATVFRRDDPVQDIVARLGVTEIIVAAREQRGGAIDMDALLACRTRGIPVIDLAAFYERTRAHVPVDSLKISWLVYGAGFVQGPLRRLAKRAFDIVSSATLLFAASPLMALTALAIKLESPGPVIYRQERVGLKGRRFMCLKFRSMRSDAEADGVARWAVHNDARITRVGAFIRKARIDELPQLISVLRGEMSMVGPRPERPSFVASLREQIPYYELRHSIKPGVTGWAQIRYRYGSTVEDARKKHQFDLYYVKNNSLFLDLLVLVETVTVVLFGEGAQ